MLGRYLLTAGVGIILICPIASALSLPSPDDTLLRQRDQSLRRVTFKWHVSEQAGVAATPETVIRDAEKSAKQFAEEEAAKRGITDPQEVAQLIAQRQADAMKSLNSSSCSFTDDRVLSRFDDTFTVAAKLGCPEGVTSQYHLYFDKDTGMVVNDSVKTNTGAPVEPAPNFVWRCNGACTSQDSGFINYLDMTSEDYLVLAGFNPAAAHGAAWSVVEQKPESITIQSPIISGNYTPAVERIVLDRKHGDFPALIRLQGDRWNITWTGDDYQKFGDTWICKRITYRQDVPGIIVKTRTWNLQGMVPSTQGAVISPQGRTSIDFRLEPPAPSTDEVHNLLSAKDANIVTYTWNGQIPNVEAVLAKRDRKTPHEHLLTTTSNAWKWSLLLVLVGIFWGVSRRYRQKTAL